MSTKWQKVDIPIPKEYSPVERQAIAIEIINFIRKRTQEENVDKNNRPFAKYSDAYKKSLDYKIARKAGKGVNLTLSGDMLGALQLLKDQKGKITIGFERGSTENAKADGNIRGTYGNSESVGPKRDFLGITKSDLAKILKNYVPGDKQDAEARVESLRQAENLGVNGEALDGEDDEI